MVDHTVVALVAERDLRPPQDEERPSDPATIEAELLVADVSIDGMCGVY